MSIHGLFSRNLWQAIRNSSPKEAALRNIENLWFPGITYLFSLLVLMLLFSRLNDRIVSLFIILLFVDMFFLIFIELDKVSLASLWISSTIVAFAALTYHIGLSVSFDWRYLFYWSMVAHVLFVLIVFVGRTLRDWRQEILSLLRLRSQLQTRRDWAPDAYDCSRLSCSAQLRLAENNNTPRGLLVALTKSGKHHKIRRAAVSRLIDREPQLTLLFDLAGSIHSDVRTVVLSHLIHPETAPTTLAYLANSKYEDVLRAVIEHKNTPQEAWPIIAENLGHIAEDRFYVTHMFFAMGSVPTPKEHEFRFDDLDKWLDSLPAEMISYLLDQLDPKSQRLRWYLAIRAGKTEKRFSDVYFPAQVALNTWQPLHVAIIIKELVAPDGTILTRERPHLYDMEFELQAPKRDRDSIQVDVLVSSQSFEVYEGLRLQHLEVPVGRDSSAITFWLRAATLGQTQVDITFMQDGAYIGQVQVPVLILPSEAEKTLMSKPEGDIVLGIDQARPDLTILVSNARSGDACQLNFVVFSPLDDLKLKCEHVGTIELTGTPAMYLESLFGELSQSLLTSDLDENVSFKRLESLGAHLYEELIPDQLKKLYWKKLRTSVQSLQIVSSDPWVPWELIRPSRRLPSGRYEEDAFLCERFILSRWILGPPPPESLEFEKLALVTVASGREAILEEAEALVSLPKIKVQRISPSLSAIYQLLEQGEFNGLHFACHGEYNPQNPNQSSILLEDNESLHPVDIAGRRRSFAHKQPLVFLNACETGRLGLALTGLGGWAQAFVGSGVGGFLGPVWEARDESAYKFAVAFYCHLLDGDTIGEAVRQARQSIKRGGDSTWLSYTLYANPLARLATE